MPVYIVYVVKTRRKLDAGQSPTLACLAAPLAACAQRHPSGYKNWLLGQRPSGDQKTNFRLVIYNSYSFTNPDNFANIDSVDF